MPQDALFTCRRMLHPSYSLSLYSLFYRYMTLLDLDQYRAKPNGKPIPAKRQSLPRHKSREGFSLAAIPDTWLERLRPLSYATRWVGFALWSLGTKEKSRTVAPTGKTWHKFNISRDSAQRGMAALEQAGLITMEKHRGRCPVVTICEVTP